MSKNKKGRSAFESQRKPPAGMPMQQKSRNNVRKNNMNYTNINKNKGK